MDGSGHWLGTVPVIQTSGGLSLGPPVITKTYKSVSVKPVFVQGDASGASSTGKTSAELLAECKEAKLEHDRTRNQEKAEILTPEVKQRIREDIAAFDEYRARSLETALHALERAPEDKKAEVFCAVEQLSDVMKDYNQTTCSDPTNCNVKLLAKNSLDYSSDALSAAADSFNHGGYEYGGSMEEHYHAREIGAELLKVATDIGTSLIPGVSAGRDAYEAITGRSLIDGHELDSIERSFAILGVATLGTAGMVKGAFKTVERIAEFAVRTEHELAVVEKGLRRSIRTAEGVADSAASLAHTNPDLGRKLDYVLGKATGSAHNVERSQDMLRQMERIGFPESQGTRTYLADHLKKALNDPTSVLRTQENGRVVRESLLNGPRGTVKVESIWEDAKLITVKIFGGGQ